MRTKLRTARWWVADCLDDAQCYSIRGKTKREVLDELRRIGLRPFVSDTYGNCWANENIARFRHPRKVEVQYTDTFDLIATLLSEGGAE